MSSQSRIKKSVPSQKELTSFRKAITTFAGMTKCDISANWTYQAAKLYARLHFGCDAGFSNIDDTDHTTKDELFLIFLTAWRKHVTQAEMTYPTLDSFKVYYEKHIEMEKLPQTELIRLHNWANWVNLALRALSNRRGFKSTLLRILPRILENIPNNPPYKYKSTSTRNKDIDVSSVNRNTIYDVEISNSVRCVESKEVKEQVKQQERHDMIGTVHNPTTISLFNKHCVTPKDMGGSSTYPQQETSIKSEFDNNYHNEPCDTSQSKPYRPHMDVPTNVFEPPVTPQRLGSIPPFFDQCSFSIAGDTSSSDMDDYWLSSPEYTTIGPTNSDDIPSLLRLSPTDTNPTMTPMVIQPKKKQKRENISHQKDIVWSYDNGGGYSDTSYETPFLDTAAVISDGDTQPYSHHNEVSPAADTTTTTTTKAAERKISTANVDKEMKAATVATSTMRTRSVSRASALAQELKMNSLTGSTTSTTSTTNASSHTSSTCNTTGSTKDQEPIATAEGVTFIPPPTTMQRDTSFMNWLGNTLSAEQVTVGLPVLCISNSPLCSPRGTAEYVPTLDCNQYASDGIGEENGKYSWLGNNEDDQQGLTSSKDWEINGNACNPLYPAIDAHNIGFLGTTMLLSPKDD